MSEIKVLKPNGQWSEAIYGLDKVHLMKIAVQYEYTKTNYCIDESNDVDIYENDYTLRELEIDGQKFNARFIDRDPAIEHDICWPRFYQRKDLTKAKFLKVRLSTLIEIANNSTYLKSVYNKLIENAEVPTPTPEGYCLNFKFADE